MFSRVLQKFGFFSKSTSLQTLDPDRVITDEIYEEDPHVFLSLEWSLQAVYCVLQREHPTVKITFEELKNLAIELSRQLREQSCVEGFETICEGISRYYSPNTDDDKEEV